MLLHFVWQGAAIAAALAVLLALTSPAQARLRYVLSCAALTLMFAVALATAAHVMTRDNTTLRRLNLAVGSNAPAPSHSPEVVSNASAKEGQGRPITDAGAAALTARPGAGSDLSSLAQPVVEAAMPWLVLTWALGVVLFSVRLARRLVADTRASRRGCRPRFPTGARHSSHALSARLRIARPVAIVASVRVSVPVVLGHLKPVDHPARPRFLPA